MRHVFRFLAAVQIGATLFLVVNGDALFGAIGVSGAYLLIRLENDA